MVTETQDHPNRLNAPKIELCSTLSLSKGLLCIAFCEAGFSLAPLHLSRTLYKSTFLCKTNPILSAVGGLQINVSILLKMDYENKRDWTLGENKPNSNPIKPNLRKDQMNINSLITKDYRKKDDFEVRINKPNSRKTQNERKRFFTKGL